MDFGRFFRLAAVVIFDFRDCREGYFDNLAVGALDFDTRRSKGLSGFHAANNTSHMLAVNGHNLNVAFAVKGLQGCEGFGYFHVLIPPRLTYSASRKRH